MLFQAPAIEEGLPEAAMASALRKPELVVPTCPADGRMGVRQRTTAREARNIMS
jgi:hypothetical protein